MGRVARTYRASGLGRLGSPFGRKAAVGFGNRATLMALDQLAQDSGYTMPVDLSPGPTGTSYGAPGLSPVTTTILSSSPTTSSTPTSATPASSSSSGWTAAQEASVLTSAINAAGVVGKQAIIGSPTVSYNPATGQYTATGGATLPSGIALSSTISSLFSNPLVLLAIAGIIAVSVMK